VTSNNWDANGNTHILFEIEDIIMNAEVQGKCNMFDNPEANIAKNTLSSFESGASFINDDYI
jgi:hypothetical protein